MHWLFLMMFLAVIIFIVGYVAIAFEHPLKLDKAAAALITGVLCWTCFFVQYHNPDESLEILLEHFADISSILFFLLGAMTIVELIDANDGFQVIAGLIRTENKSRLLLIISVFSFLLSALLDNLTTAIVMMSLCSRILEEKEDRLWFAGIIVIAANAGGAWSPLGDVSTTMLWIGGQITAISIMKTLILPALLVCFIPTWIVARKFRNQKIARAADVVTLNENIGGSRTILITGIGCLLFVPLFKTVTHQPPFMGMLLALGLMWVFVTVLRKKEREVGKEVLGVNLALQKIDTPSILFFLGILLAVSALDAFGALKLLAQFLDEYFHNNYIIGLVLGLLSALVDNVPLVAATQGMYGMDAFPPDDTFWQFLTLTTGTGGSIVIIGSAAGVAAMGIEKIDFIWYLKNIALLALIGFLAGAGMFMLLHVL